jgi:hypothetical protein
MMINFPGTGPDDDRNPVDLCEVAEHYFHEAAQEVAQVIAEIRAGRFDEVTEARKCIRNLKDFFALAMEERNRIDKLRKQTVRTVGAPELDLSAARDEIGRRLALLRDAGSH